MRTKKTLVKNIFASHPVLHKTGKQGSTMTIKIERDSQLRVSDSHSDSSTSHVPPFETGIVEDDFLLVNFPQMCSSVGKLRSSTLDDDTASTGSFSSDSTDSSTDSGLRRVSFANDLVTDAWTRPYTPRSEVSSLFYSTEETTRYVALGTFSTRISVDNS
jgi:hypothetical protein